ncbi:dienelactone hydrolase family protein [Variovorax sp. J22G40]|uniref:carboxylesterase family protein n=1 Tax=Variovorax sp. J22G40 TaxID=3053505 RepID=UPI002576B78E|nr:dienelactone hydrolase family protein [Variovorax sp. J22G40]MDM0087196.1 dienelactone hydrolase family protein [Variovorax sp. J22G40]
MSTLERNTWLTSRGPLPYLLARTAAPKPAPALLFLHGARDRGHDLDLLLRWAPPRLVAESAGLPYHFIAPQLPEGATWPERADDLLSLVDTLAASGTIDPARLLVAGFSLGAAGAWEIAARHPGRFAGLVAVSGRVPETARPQDLRGLPVRIFHGGSDDKLPATAIEAHVEALRLQGNPVAYTLYPDGDHFIADRAFGDPALEGWLLARRRTATTPPDRAA